MDVKRAWRKVRELRGWKAAIFYVVLGVALGYGLRYGLGFVLGTPDPVVTVISESMYPYYNVGDVLLVVGVPYRDIKVGDVIVYRLPGKPIPIVHRVIAKTPEGVITKGDNNPLPDPWCPIRPKEISGKVVLRIPYVGYPKALIDRYLYGG
ncbi:signal peptidase I [Methanopyrus sp. SNP6]|uniref:signal peptidase I n=1 Tax=Methanopyrus sp. SNP6 TaxID=1937005 RepID=UPI00143A716D|nr:signal peptidase I [Methanopyrus sp. SNP6]